MPTSVQKLAVQLKDAAEQFLSGRPLPQTGKPATEEQFCRYVVAMAKKMAARYAPGSDNYQPIEAGEDPEAYRRLDTPGYQEVPDEDLREISEGEAPEQMDFEGGQY